MKLFLGGLAGLWGMERVSINVCFGIDFRERYMVREVGVLGNGSPWQSHTLIQ
jgi:hypothetical protein